MKEKRKRKKKKKSEKEKKNYKYFTRSTALTFYKLKLACHKKIRDGN